MKKKSQKDPKHGMRTRKSSGYFFGVMALNDAQMSSREKKAYTTDVIKVQISDKGKRCSFGSSFPKKDDYPKKLLFYVC